MDEWNRGYFDEEPRDAHDFIESSAGSKYKTGYSYGAEAPPIPLPPFEVRLDRDTIVDANQEVTFTIIPKRDVHILRLYADEKVAFNSMAYNGMQVKKDSLGTVLGTRRSKFLMHYNVSESDSLEVKYSLPLGVEPNFSLLEYSLDLLDNPAFTVNKRPKHLMPKPFVTTDAVIIKKGINLNELRSRATDTLTPLLDE